MIKGVEFFFLTPVQGVLFNGFVLRIIIEELLTNVLVGFNSDLPLRVLYPLKYAKRGYIIFVLLSRDVFLDLLLVALSLI